MKCDIKKLEYVFLIGALLGGGVYLLSNYGKTVFSIILPFAVAFVLSELLRSPIDRLSRRTRIPRNVLCFVFVPLVYAALFFLLFFLVSRMFSELSSLSGVAQSSLLELPDYTRRLVGKVSGYFPGFSGISDSFRMNASDIITTFVKSLAGFVTDMAKNAAAFVPKLVVFAVVTVVSTCYFAKDRSVINRFFLFQLPPRGKVFISQFKSQFLTTTLKYLKAYLLIGAITFTELLCGFLFIKREYAFVLALAVTIVDILPVLGTGVVLLPWAAAEAVMGDVGDCIRLVALYIFITVSRQIIEPKIIGSMIGLHPLLTLFAVYAGIKLLGIAGVFLFPVLFIVCRNLNERGLVRLYKTPPAYMGSTLDAARLKYRKFKGDK